MDQSSQSISSDTAPLLDNLLITGAGGFIGRTLLAAATDIGHPVVATRREGLDLTDAAGVHELIAHARPDVIFHLAFDKPRGPKDLDRSLEANLRMLANLNNATASLGLEAKTIVAGSAAEYGILPDHTAINESTPLAPVSPYGAVKAALEAAALEADRPAIWLRNFNVTGPGQPPGFPLSDWIARLVESERHGGGMLRTGRLDLVRDFLDVRDVASAYLAAMRLDLGTVVNLCSGVATRLDQLVTTLVELTEASVEVHPEPEPENEALVSAFSVGDCALMQRLTGWAPDIRLEDSLRDSLAWERRRVEAS